MSDVGNSCDHPRTSPAESCTIPTSQSPWNISDEDSCMKIFLVEWIGPRHRTYSKVCSACQAAKSSPPVAPLHPWVWLAAPWKRVHINFARPFFGKMFHVTVDALPKWPEVAMMSSTTSQLTMEVVRSLFNQYGLPEQLVSDNGPQFTSEEFAQFNSIR